MSGEEKSMCFSTATAVKQKILIVDDEPINIEILGNLFAEDYKVFTTKSPKRVLDLAKRHQPDLVLLDVVMPEMSGYDVAHALRTTPETEDIPIIFVTSMIGVDNEAHAFDFNAVDYIEKPISPQVVMSRVRAHLSRVRVNVLEKTYQQTVYALGRAAGYKDNETRRHITRMSMYSKLIAAAMGMRSAECDLLELAAPMHDVGKIGIPDDILLKPGKLTPEEWRIMKRHPEIGKTIIGEQRSALLRLASSIAYTHHEKWDGSGYPLGTIGEDIPLEGRICAIADVFDALMSERPYKAAWSLDATCDYIHEEKGKHFDPHLVSLFLGQKEKIKEIRAHWG